MSAQSHHISLIVEPQDAGQRLDVYLTTHAQGFSRSRVQKLIETGAVRVNAQNVPSRTPLRAGDRVEMEVPPPEAAVPQPQAMDLEVLFEDEHLLILNKPPGLVVHPGAGQPDGTLVNALLARPGTVSIIGGVERPGIVHRLDKDTSGLMVIAKTDSTHAALSNALSRREVKRVYHTLALREFKSDSGRIEAPVGRHPTNRVKMAVRPQGQGRSALTHWKVLERFGGISLVECRLATGRTHQIRVHLAHDNHPVLGDDLYGGSVALALQLVSPRDQEVRNALRQVRRQMLHAREIGFTHPVTGTPLHFSSPPPEDFQHVLRVLRQTSQGT